ncbi:MAG: hypothetical protein Q4B42_05635, partial [Oscillospiraceae bacterium]|nr:hypothetical protein [Oscillospiraceae bacterium]
DTLVEPVLKNAAVPVFLKWRTGALEKMGDIDGEMAAATAAYLRSDEVKELLAAPVAKWMKPVAARLEEKTIPICVKYSVPYTALSLMSSLDASQLELELDAKKVFAVNEISWLINAIISVLVGLLCGGGGVALIAGGLPGIIAGAAVSLLLLFLGKDAMQEAVLSADIPLFMRKAIPEKFFENRAQQIEEKVSAQLYESLLGEAGEEMRERLIGEISGQIESCLIKMAKIVEIPLG